jgi:hypothetical protein
VAPDPGVPTDPEVPEVPVPDPADPADPVAGVSTLSVDDVPGVPVELADGEPLADADWLGDDLRVGVVFGLAELEGVVEGVGVVLGQSEAVAVTLCSAEGLGFLEVLVGFGVGVGLLLTLELALGLGLGLTLALGLLLALVVLVGLAELLAGLLDWSAVLVFAAAFDELGEAAGDDEQVEAPLAVAPSELGTWDALLSSGWPPPALADGDAELCDPKPDSTVFKNWLRSGGTAASTTPTANTAKPTASAGRSIASRQSPDRCGACRAWDGPEPCPLRSDGAVRLVHS